MLQEHTLKTTGTTTDFSLGTELTVRAAHPSRHHVLLCHFTRHSIQGFLSAFKWFLHLTAVCFLYNGFCGFVLVFEQYLNYFSAFS